MLHVVKTVPAKLVSVCSLDLHELYLYSPFFPSAAGVCAADRMGGLSAIIPPYPSTTQYTTPASLSYCIRPIIGLPVHSTWTGTASTMFSFSVPTTGMSQHSASLLVPHIGHVISSGKCLNVFMWLLLQTGSLRCDSFCIQQIHRSSFHLPLDFDVHPQPFCLGHLRLTPLAGFTPRQEQHLVTTLHLLQTVALYLR